MRSDALRNQQNILDAARSEITAHGADVSMEQIARAAGVAVGTLYRHYPTKTDLVQAVFSEIADGLVARAEATAASDAGSAMERIVSFISAFLDESLTNHALKAAIPAGGITYMTDEQLERARIAFDSLLTEARSDGELRDGITSDDIYLMMVSAPETLDPVARGRWLTIVAAGISA